MSKLYDIDQRIESIIEALEPDPETGELPMDEEELLDELDRCQLDRKNIMQYLAKLYLNNRSDIDGIKAECERLTRRRNTIENRNERILGILDRECAGVKTDLGVATMSYRHSKSINIIDQDAAIEWLCNNKHTDCIKIAPATISKTEVAKLIKAGERITGIEQVEGVSASLK